MPSWSDSRIEEKVKNELEELKTIMNIISQLPIEQAKRILIYCLNYVQNGDGNLPMMEESVDGALKALLGGLKTEKQSKSKQ